MSYNSRIKQPGGEFFVKIQRHFVARLGLAGASVMGLLEFLDQAQPTAGLPLATRQRILADLQGIVGKNKVDEALSLLLGMGWVKKIERREVKKNIVQWGEYSLDCDRINADLAAGSPGVPNPGSPASPNRDQPGPKSGTNSVPVPGPDPVPDLGSPNKEEVEPDLEGDLEGDLKASSAADHQKIMKAASDLSNLLNSALEAGELGPRTADALATLAAKVWVEHGGDRDRDVKHVRNFILGLPAQEEDEWDEKLAWAIRRNCNFPSELLKLEVL